MTEIDAKCFYEVEEIHLTEQDKRKWNIMADSCFFLVRYFRMEGFNERVSHELLAPFNFDSEGYRARKYFRRLQGLPEEGD